LIEAKGLPDFQDWRFITPTFRRKVGSHGPGPVFDGPLEAYQVGSDHMRRWMAACRKAGLWTGEAKWVWKFEFQSDGWPHWHLLVERKKKFTLDELRLIGKLWGFGRVKTKRVNSRKFRYDFKYAFKSVCQESDDENLTGIDTMAPAWFLDYIGSKMVPVKWLDSEGVEHSERVEKPVTFARVRFWQTSRGFYTGIPPVPSPKSEQRTWIRPRSVRRFLSDQASTVQVVARRSSGAYLTSQTVRLSCPLKEFWPLVCFDVVEGGACGLGIYSFMIPPHRIQTDQLTKWKLKPLLSRNRLTLPRAIVLRSRRRDFLRS
jgi:hypothetical protein